MIRYTEEHVLPRLDRAIASVVADRGLAETTAPPTPATLPMLDRAESNRTSAAAVRRG